jgi:hypothetical protein
LYLMSAAFFLLSILMDQSELSWNSARNFNYTLNIPNLIEQTLPPIKPSSYYAEHLRKPNAKQPQWVESWGGCEILLTHKCISKTESR